MIYYNIYVAVTWDFCFDVILFLVSNMIYHNQRWCVFRLKLGDCSARVYQWSTTEDDVCDEDEDVRLSNFDTFFITFWNSVSLVT